MSSKEAGSLSPSQREIDSLSGLSIFICLLVIILIYLFVGAAVYLQWETSWDYLGAVYFIFISTR